MRRFLITSGVKNAPFPPTYSQSNEIPLLRWLAISVALVPDGSLRFYSVPHRGPIIARFNFYFTLITKHEHLFDIVVVKCIFLNII